MHRLVTVETQERLGRSQVPSKRQHEIDCLGSGIHGPVNVPPPAGESNIRFVHPPGSIRIPQVTTKPRIHGLQTAKVAGEGEIDVDKYGRIILHFFWDREKKDSRRVRIAHIWSDTNWGGIVIPRVGQEVIVRVLHRGHGRVARKLVGLTLAGESAPPSGTAAVQTTSPVFLSRAATDAFGPPGVQTSRSPSISGDSE